MKVSTVGLDLAKNVFQVHAVDEAGEVIARKALRRRQVMSFFERLEPCLVGMEACGTSHYCARELYQLANKAARIAWAVMTRGEIYRAPQPSSQQQAAA